MPLSDNVCYLFVCHRWRWYYMFVCHRWQWCHLSSPYLHVTHQSEIYLYYFKIMLFTWKENVNCLPVWSDLTIGAFFYQIRVQIQFTEHCDRAKDEVIIDRLLWKHFYTKHGRKPLVYPDAIKKCSGIPYNGLDGILRGRQTRKVVVIHLDSGQRN